ncbi:Rv0361 family membrane protein [Nocardia flavorosea]|uniref:Rv0361 family membrane protein n=1 Tax=Nocardia flavorosea TaxID=53429 RepID=UPI003FCC42C0
MATAGSGAPVAAGGAAVAAGAAGKEGAGTDAVQPETGDASGKPETAAAAGAGDSKTGADVESGSEGSPTELSGGAEDTSWPVEGESSGKSETDTEVEARSAGSSPDQADGEQDAAQADAGEPETGTPAQGGGDDRAEAAEAGADGSDAGDRSGSSGDSGPGPDNGEARTVVIPRQQRPDEARTVAMPAQKPDPDATARIDMSQVRKAGRPAQPPGGPQGPARTDRVGPGASALSKPPATPRPQSGPKRPGPQAPGRPDQPAPQRPGGPPPGPRQGGRPQPPPPRPGTAPSPADLKPTAAEQRVAQAPPQRAQPQRVEPAPAPAATPGDSNKKWLIAGGVAVALVVALIAILVGAGSGDDSPQARISAAIGDYTGALENGDLPALRDATCGALHDYYQGLSEEQFAGVHRQAVSEGSIPEVTGVDAVKITDRTALAQVTVQTDADPEETTRTFDLQETEAGWKVCDPPAGAQ